MIEFYPEIRLVHIGAALTSGGFFLLRGLMLFAGYRGAAMAAPLRFFSYTVDTVLLTAALMLTTIIKQYPFVHGWLTVKVVLLLVYIALGMLAFHARIGRGARLGCWFAALAAFAFIYTVARAHHPAGLLAPLAG